MSQASDEGWVPDWSQVRRPRGPWIFLLLLALGILPAAYYAYKEPRLRAEHERRLAAAPTTLEGRVEAWHVHGGPMIHHRIANVARASAEHPWLVTHRLDLGDGGPPEVWGIDTSKLPLGISRVEGGTVVVELPSPVALGRVDLELDERKLPTFDAAADVPDPDARLEYLATWFLEKLPQALEKDIEGASLVVRVGEADGS